MAINLPYTSAGLSSKAEQFPGLFYIFQASKHTWPYPVFASKSGNATSSWGQWPTPNDPCKLLTIPRAKHQATSRIINFEKNCSGHQHEGHLDYFADCMQALMKCRCMIDSLGLKVIKVHSMSSSKPDR
jgi:hypothetical protein